MKLLELVIENFRGFKKASTFVFNDLPGLYFMQGRNDVEPRLGSNGAGKSSTWEALKWLFFERTSKGLKAGAVGNWAAGKGTRVALAFEADDGSVCEAVRTWKPNTWTMAVDSSSNVVDLVKHPNNPLLQQLRLESTPFLNCVLMAQGQAMFLDLKPEAKASLFSEVMGLDKWLDYATEAGKRAGEQDRVSRRLESQVAELRGKLSALSTADLFISAVQWKEDKADQLDRLDALYEEGKERSKRAKVRMEDAQAAQDRADKRKRATADEFDRHAQGPLRDLEIKTRRQRDVMIGLERDREHAGKLLDDLLDGVDSCPTCGRAFDGVTVDELESHIAESRNAWKAVDEAFKQQRELVDELAHELEAALKVSDDLEAARDRSRKAAEDCYRDFQHARTAYDMEEKTLDRLEDEIHDLEEKPNPYQRMLDDQAKTLERLRDDLRELQQKLDDSNARYAMFTFWAKGFKEVRLQLIGEALDELEIEVNSEVMALGLVDWELRFDIDKETKSGSLSRGFTVMVLSPHNNEPVPWEAWSGGESQRLRMAGQMGLANLIRTRTGATIDLEVWDEPTKELSEEGVTDLLNALAERARRERRQIWIVDHRSHGYGAFAGGATVVKDAKGSRFVQTTV